MIMMYSAAPFPRENSPGNPSRSARGRLRSPVLAIDYGLRRMGLALSDALGLTARPLATWNRTNRRHDLARLRDLCRRHGVAGIVVGWPLRLDGTPGEMAAEAARFAGRVRKLTGLPVELQDERLSSWEAGELLREQPPRPKRRDRPVDDLAAAVILRDYLSRRQAAAEGSARPGASEAATGAAGPAET